MAGGTPSRAGRAQAQRESDGLPKSMAALRLATIASIRLYRKLEATAFTEQYSRGDEDDESYAPVDRGGAVLSYADYRKALAEKEKRLKDSVPPAVWRAAQKRVEEELEAEAG